MALNIAQKLRLTSVVLGTASRKDLAAAFRAVNPKTAFDVGRADKWLQGRAQPREQSVYDDWAKVLRLEQPGAWIAESDLPSFAAAIAARHGIDAAELERRAHAQSAASPGHDDKGIGLALAGTYAWYSRAWSPYYRGQLIRGRLAIEAGPGAHAFTAIYRETFPTGQLQLSGPVTPAKRSLYLHLKEVGGEAQSFLCLFPHTQPVSVLGGYMVGTAIFAPEAQPSLTRILLVRLRDAPAAEQWGGPLPPGISIAADLASLGIVMEHPEAVDRQLGQFLSADSEGGVNQIPPSEYRAILDVFDRHWLQHAG